MLSQHPLNTNSSVINLLVGGCWWLRRPFRETQELISDSIPSSRWILHHLKQNLPKQPKHPRSNRHRGLFASLFLCFVGIFASSHHLRSGWMKEDEIQKRSPRPFSWQPTYLFCSFQKSATPKTRKTKSCLTVGSVARLTSQNGGTIGFQQNLGIARASLSRLSLPGLQRNRQGNSHTS